MKKVFLYAYDQINLGDDLFVHTIVNRYPDVKFYLWSNNLNKTTFSRLKNLTAVDSDSTWIRFLRKIRSSFAARYKSRKEKVCTAVVYIGGSLFIEYENWKQINSWWEYESLNRNFYVIGANFGPYHTAAYRDSFAKIFSNMRDVCLRDRYSQALFSDVETVRYAPDILFAYPIQEKQLDEKQVFVSVVDCTSKDEGDNKLADYQQSYIYSMVNVLKGFIGKGYKIILSSFCKAEGDEAAVELIRAMLSTDMVEVVNYNGINAPAILDKISESSFVIATRFHAAILGFAAGKPVLPVVYSDKTSHVLEDIYFAGQYLDIRKSKQIDIDSLLMNKNNQKLSEIDKIKKQSEIHFMKLDQILNKN